MKEPLIKLFQRTDVRLASFGLMAVSGVYGGFMGVAVTQAETFIRLAGYYVLLLTFVLWLWALARLWSEGLSTGLTWSKRELLVAGLGILLFTGTAISNEVFGSKILNDEYVLQSTAFNMHYTREVAAMARGYNILGTFVTTDIFLDKRPNFYPFLVSLVHDFTGYRPLNAHLLNAALLPVALALAYYLGRALTDWRGGLLAMCLLGSLPLLVQNATGAGMELLNLTMLLAGVALAAAWLAQPNETRLTAFVLAVVLLAQCRYESALYVLSAALVILVGWWRSRRIIMSWTTVSVPWLLIPVALHNKVLSHSPVLWEMKDDQTSRFGVEYVAENMTNAVKFLFSDSDRVANSLVLSVFGAFGAAWVVWRLLVRRKGLFRFGPHPLAWLLFGFGVLANTTLVMFYFWSSFMDPMAARFALPLYLLLTMTVVLLVRWLDHWLPATSVFLFLVAACFLGLSIPKQAHHIYSRVGVDEMEWERRYVAARPPGERLILANNSTIVWLLQKTPSILLNRARLVPDRLRYQLGEPTFREILVLQSLRPSTVAGDYQITPSDRLPKGYQLELLTERRFGTKIARISRLLAVEQDQSTSQP